MCVTSPPLLAQQGQRSLSWVSGSFAAHTTYHHATGKGNAPATVRVRHYIAVADAQECDGGKPHGV